MVSVQIEPSWGRALRQEFEKTYFEMLTTYVRKEYATCECFPRAKDLFRAYNCCPITTTKVVIVGQDPYHEPGQAMGLAFGTQPEAPLPPSLQNIFKELKDDIGVTHTSGDLSCWAEQGVLLLNSVLSVRVHQPLSHENKGWEEFTDATIEALVRTHQHLVFILWGKYAQNKCRYIDPKNHCILSASHPSPLSAYHGFFGSRPFSKCNTYLAAHKIVPINW